MVFQGNSARVRTGQIIHVIFAAGAFNVLTFFFLIGCNSFNISTEEGVSTTQPKVLAKVTSKKTVGVKPHRNYGTVDHVNKPLN